MTQIDVDDIDGVEVCVECRCIFLKDDEHKYTRQHYCRRCSKERGK